jgi:3,4-dihydroxy 2-butanone 4-phosphate synthase/GTP cyclohydrolase II
VSRAARGGVGAYNPAMRREQNAISPVAEIVAEIRAGRIVVLVDDEDRENEGDLVFAAEFVTPEKINFLATHGRGLICMPITETHAARLGLKPMVSENRSRHGTNFTVSIEAAEGIATGISAHDRALTIKVAVAEHAKPEDIVQPGHVFPLIAEEGGVLVRAGHTEACCDLARLAGLTPAAVLCEIMRADGTMARLPDLLEFAAAHQLKIGTIADLIEYRSRNESLVRRLEGQMSERDIETPWGRFRMIAFHDLPTQSTHLALVLGEVSAAEETLVRVHEPLSVMDLLDADSAAHSWTIPGALAAVAKAGRGVVVLLHRPESAAELRERALADAPTPPAKMDLRNYGIGAQILRDLNVGRMRLLAKPRKMPSMVGFDLEVTGYESEPPLRQSA